MRNVNRRRSVYCVGILTACVSVHQRLALFVVHLIMLGMCTASIAHAGLDIRWNGFGTIAGGVIDDDAVNNAEAFPHNLYEESAKYDIDSRFALQGVVLLDDHWSVSAQAVAPAFDDYNPKLEWGYLSYEANEQFTLRFGRMRRPIYNLSDYFQVSYAYPWIRPPLEVYSRDLAIYDSVNGINGRYQLPLGNWDFATEVYLGYFDGTSECGCKLEADIKTRDDIGVVFELDGYGLGWRFGYHRTDRATITPLGEGGADAAQLFGGLQASGIPSIAAIADELSLANREVEFYNLAFDLDIDNWLVSAEYIHVPIERSLAPEESSWYAMLGRRLDNITLHYTYGVRKRKNDENFTAPIEAVIAINPAAAPALNPLIAAVNTTIQGTVIDQSSHTIGLRYDFDAPYSLKFEYERIRDNPSGVTGNLFSVAFDFVY